MKYISLYVLRILIGLTLMFGSVLMFGVGFGLLLGIVLWSLFAAGWYIFVEEHV